MNGTSQQQRHVLITGGSGGIGLEIARCAAADGCSVTIVSRSLESLQAAAGAITQEFDVPVFCVAVDLSHSAGVDELLSRLDDHELPVDVLVNNAGFGIAEDFTATSEADLLGMVDLNVRTPVQLTRALLPNMISRSEDGSGAHSQGVLNIASVAGMQPGPGFAVYHATKAFMISWSHGLREDLRKHGIAVTCVNPGPVPTGFDARAGIGATPLRRLADVSAARVGKAAWHGLNKGRVTVTPGAVPKLMSFGSKISPRAAVVAVTKAVYR